MEEKKILVTIDFTEVNDKSLEYAAMIAKKTSMTITLLHIISGKSDPLSEERLNTIATRIKSEKDIECNHIIRKGNIFNQIADEACNLCYRLMIIGSHGIKGVREKFFGTDILKLVKSIPLPVVVIQKDYNIPQYGINNIVFPASTHSAFKQKINATADLAAAFNAKVHLYTVQKPGTDWPDELIANLEMAKQSYKDKNIDFIRINEDQTAYSVGYSKQILQYANKVHADMIALISVPSKEYYHIADSDKEAILTNKYFIPILCTSDKSIV